jgi:hypothetical protein
LVQEAGHGQQTLARHKLAPPVTERQPLDFVECPDPRPTRWQVVSQEAAQPLTERLRLGREGQIHPDQSVARRRTRTGSCRRPRTMKLALYRNDSGARTVNDST